MMIAILAAVLLDAQPAAATAAPSATPASAPAATPAKAADDDDKVICKSQKVTGSRFSTRICHTKHEWAQIEKDSRDELMDQQSQSFRNPSNGH
jgi:invasion protein IalB